MKPLQKHKGLVLLIDQQPDLQDHIFSCLNDEGYRVQITNNGDDGLSYWREFKPPVVICDVMSPGVDGLTVLQEIALSDSDTQVIMISDVGEMDYVVKALRLGATDFLLKPISDPEVLVHAVNRAFEEHLLTAENRLYKEQLEAKNKELNNSLRLLKEDQEAGRAVQLKLLPASDRNYGNIHIEYKIIPSLYLSGDFIDYFSLGDDRIGFYLADVSGHGASSAFVTVLLKTMANRVKQQFRDGHVKGLLPAEILQKANEELIPLGLGKHLAIFCGYIDQKEKKLVYCSAAHLPPPILMTGGRISTLEGRGLPVGLFKDVTYDNQEVSLEDEFRLVLFSDGVLEVMPQSNMAEKEAYLMEIVSNGIHNVEALLDHLDLRNQSAVPDDIALMTVSCSL